MNTLFRFKSIVLKVWGTILFISFGWLLTQLVLFVRNNPGIGFVEACRLLSEGYLEFICEILESFGPFALLGMMVIYVVRPFLLIPASFLTILSGMLFGPLWGVLVTMIGENIAANISFYVARIFKKDIDYTPPKTLQRANKLITQNSLLSVIILRVMWIPFDLVSYGLGASSVSWKNYSIGTFLGIIPGMLSIIFVGSGVQMGGHTLYLGLLMFVVTCGLGYAIKIAHPQIINRK